MLSNFRFYKAISIIFILILATTSFSKNQFDISIQAGLNFSRPVMLPGSLSSNGDSYQINYIPGYYLAGAGEFKLNQIFTITSGVGIKTLNFNFDRQFANAISPPGCIRSIILSRLYYYVVPVYLRINLTTKSAYFLLIGAEYSHLLREVNWELWLRSNPHDEHSYCYELYKWFKPDATVLYFGGGFQLNSKLSALLRTGLTINRVDQPERQPYDGYYRSQFYFSKRLAELLFTIQYTFK
jgi:hypothetical protein